MRKSRKKKYFYHAAHDMLRHSMLLNEHSLLKKKKETWEKSPNCYYRTTEELKCILQHEEQTSYNNKMLQVHQY